MREQRHFVLARRSVGGQQCAATILHRGIAAAANFREVIDRSADSCNQFVNLRSSFPAIWERIRGGTHLVRPEAQQMLALSVKRAHVRSKKLVRRAHEKITIEGPHVNRTE